MGLSCQDYFAQTFDVTDVAVAVLYLPLHKAERVGVGSRQKWDSSLMPNGDKTGMGEYGCHVGG